MTYNGYKFFAQNGEHLATIYQSCFLIVLTPSNDFVMPPFNRVHMLRVMIN